MATALTRSGPFDSVSYTESNWREWFTDVIGSGLIAGKLNEGAVTAGSGRQVLVASLHAWVAGAHGALDAQTAIALATNTSGSTRIDRIVLRNNYTANQLELDVIQGTPGGSAPALTDNASMKEIALAQVSLSSGYTNVSAGNITDERPFLRKYGTLPGALVSGAVSQSFSTNTDTTVKFLAETYDTHSAYNLSTGVFTAPMAGWYQADFTIAPTATDTGMYRTRIAANGVTYPKGAFEPSALAGGAPPEAPQWNFGGAFYLPSAGELYPIVNIEGAVTRSLGTVGSIVYLHP